MKALFWGSLFVPGTPVVATLGAAWRCCAAKQRGRGAVAVTGLGQGISGATALIPGLGDGGLGSVHRAERMPDDPQIDLIYEGRTSRKLGSSCSWP